MDYLTFLLSLLLSWLALHFLLSLIERNKSSSRKLPPGPAPLPVVGNFFQLGNKPHRSLADLAKSHGPLMTLHLGWMPTVIISSASMAKDVLRTHDVLFSNRMVTCAPQALNHHKYSVVWLPVADSWRNLRKICNSHVFSSSRLDASQHLRRQKVDELVSYVEKCCDAGVAVEIGKAAFGTAINLLSNTFFSIDLLELDSSATSEFKEVMREMMIEVGKPNLGDYFPVLRRLDLQRIKSHLTVLFGKMINILDEMINRSLSETFKTGEPNDTLGELLRIGYENGTEFGRLNILHLLLDLFAAGTDTTSTSVEWAMAELLHNPEKMAKAQAELREVIGAGNLVGEGDMARLPYLQCILKETLRLHPAAPLLLPRIAADEIELCGFTVPKNAQVLVNAWAIQRDPSVWENPDSFEPERFLGVEVDVKGRDFELIPFGAGRRICPGLPLAMRMLQLILASLLNSFDWKLEDGEKPENMNMDDEFGITLQKSQPLRVIPVRVGHV
ncbi:hypothetical protein Droror1_Dr00005334 [Drosera rotundifolia]